MALPPYLEPMIPAGRRLGLGSVELQKTPPHLQWRRCMGSRRPPGPMTGGPASHLFPPGEGGEELRHERPESSLKQLGALPEVPHHHQQHRRADGGGVGTLPRSGGTTSAPARSWLTQSPPPPARPRGSNALRRGFRWKDQIYAARYGTGHPHPLHAALHRDTGPSGGCHYNYFLRLYGTSITGPPPRSPSPLVRESPGGGRE